MSFTLLVEPRDWSGTESGAPLHEWTVIPRKLSQLHSDRTTTILEIAFNNRQHYYQLHRKHHFFIITTGNRPCGFDSPHLAAVLPPSSHRWRRPQVGGSHRNSAYLGTTSFNIGENTGVVVSLILLDIVATNLTSFRLWPHEPVKDGRRS